VEIWEMVVRKGEGEVVDGLAEAGARDGEVKGVQ